MTTPKPLSNSQIAKLGDRLRDGTYTAGDLILLSEYRASFAPALAEVVAGIRSIGPSEPTARPEKSLKSIIYKLNRLSTKLDQIRDIAGCRIVVTDMRDQNQYTESMRKLFSDCRVFDHREAPHSGYRAVHLELRTSGRRVEVQIRTELQDMWAQCSEQWALATEDIAIKYGGGPPRISATLLAWSGMIWKHEAWMFEWYQDLEVGKSVPVSELHERLQSLLRMEAELRSSLLRFKHEADRHRATSGD